MTRTVPAATTAATAATRDGSQEKAEELCGAGPPANGAPRIRTLVVDDSSAFLDLLEHEVRRGLPRLEVVGRGNDGISAMELVELTAPDLVLLDLQMPGMTGFEVLRVLRERAPVPKVVVLTSHRGSFYREACERLGGDGFVHKGDLMSQLAPEVERLFGRPGDSTHS